MPGLTLGFETELEMQGKVVDGVFTIVPGSPVKAFGGRLQARGGAAIDLIELVQAIIKDFPDIGLKLEIKDVLFAGVQAQENKYVFGLKVGINLDLTQLPLAGPMIRKALPANETVSIEGIELLLSSKALSRTETDFLKKAFPANQQDGVRFPETVNAGIDLSAVARLGGTLIDLSLPSTASPQDAKAASIPNVPAAAGGSKSAPLNPSDKTKWIELKKTFGPVLLERIGFKFEDGAAAFMLDGTLTLAALTFSVQGLGAGIRLKERKPLFYLDGLALSFTQGPLEISGGLLKVSDSPLQLDGALLLRTVGFSLAALGSYADLNGTPSLFVFAAIQRELGGPAFFFVTGLAFGFGVNRALKLPDINEVQNFPLIKAATDPDYMGKNMDLRAISEKLREYLPPTPGNFWIAAGVKFTSFRQIDSFALLSVSFGTQFQIAMLGLSKIFVPKPPAPVIVYAELAMKAVFSTESGLLSFEARLTENSYILRKDFKLRGGFAFYSWFAGQHEGDFAISLGGYHPRFLPPAHYPRPDLVQFYCKTGDVTIQGSCYFALCPSAIMAGGSLSLVFQSGGIKAWFIAYANFLVQWKPLHYDIEIAISVGVSLNIKVAFVRVSLSIELDASVNLYGPPLGGRARISLHIVSFTVRFGEDRNVPPPLLWESNDPEKSFAKSFLLNPDVTQTLISDGLLEEIQHGGQTTRLVNPHRLLISCRTQVPATAAIYNAHDISGIDDLKINGNLPRAQPWWNDHLGIRPMGKSQFYSLLEVSFGPNISASADHMQQMMEYLDQYIAISAVTKSLPRALWANEGMNVNVPGQDQMVFNALVGLEIKTKPGPRPWETPALDLKVLSYDRYKKNFVCAQVQAKTALPDYGEKTVSSTVNAVAAQRTAILKVLRRTGRRIMDPEAVQLGELQKNARYIFQVTPAMARVGQYPPRGYLET